MLNRLRKLTDGLTRTREAVFNQVSDLFDRRQLDEDLWIDLEELLLQADVGVATTDLILERTRAKVEEERIRDTGRAREALIDVMTDVLGGSAEDLRLERGRVNVILVVGVNGSGKTTSIAKLASYLKRQGQGVMIAAADTFRAAAIEQLQIWGERVNVPVIAHQQNADPGAVVFDSWQAASARHADVLLVDTAGRLHTKFNLMEELRKLRRILERQDPSAPHEVLLVLDATTGQNALIQAREFLGTAGVSGLVLTKLDGTARGGSIFPIAHELKLPIKFVGTGEQLDDIAEFDPRSFVEALLRSTR